MTFQVGVNTIIQFIIAFAAILNGVILWKFRFTPGVRYLILLDSLVAVWAVTYAFEFATPFLEEKILWSQLSYLGIAFAPLAYYLFTTGFSQRSHWLSYRNIALLSILPVIITLLVFTNGQHQLVWTKVTLDPDVNIAHYYHGAVFWAYWIYAELLVIVGLFNLISSVYRFPEFYKSQVYTLLIGSVFPIAGNIMYVFGLNPFPGFDWTPALFVIAVFIITYGMARYRMFDLVPIARNKLPDIINDGIIICNIDGVIEYFNPAASQLPEARAEMKTGELFALVFPSYKNVMKNLDKNQETRVELHTQGDGLKYFDIIMTPLFKNKRFSGHLLIFHDITLLKETEKKLVDKNRQLTKEIELKETLIADLDAFAHTVAHDIKGPISSIVSTAGLIPEFLESGDKAVLSELVEMIRVSANKSMHITDELLTLASVRKQKVPTGPLDMGGIFAEAKMRIETLANEYNAEISGPESWPVVIGYAAWIEEVWVNYLSNAIKYGGNPPVIKAGADGPGNGFVKFWVKDNGGGITGEQQALLFSQFTRLNPDIGHGHGLGLSIVKRIIEELEGTTGVESTGIKGEGSLFYFTLPVAGKD